MTVRPALVDCVILSLQDGCVFYPFCKCCFTRIQAEQQDTKRCRCPKCGYICAREEVEHRYRLSLTVTRDESIFGVTVFGTCLNQFFGIHATGLHRLVENVDGPVGASTRSTLLVKAVQDCFIGRRFIFGIKVTKTDREPWLQRHVANGTSSEDKVQLIASQMILPKALGLEGCTVVSYYRILLQKAEQYELGSTDPSKTSRPLEISLLRLPLQSPASSFSSATLSTSSVLHQTLQRSQYQDSTLTPTPPWQQSLGLVTSSAEQEEGCSTQERDAEHSRQTDKTKTPKGSGESNNVIEERALSPLLPFQCRSYDSLSFAKSPCSSDNTNVVNTPILDNCFSPSPPGHNSSKKNLFTGQLTTTHLKTLLSDSLAWEDLPFSESLTEFLGEENKEFDFASETEQNQNFQNLKETPRNNQDVRSQDENLPVESPSAHQRYKQITDNDSQIFLSIIDTPAANGADRDDLPEQVCKNPVRCVNNSQATVFFLHECNQENEKMFSASFENEEEELLEGDTYNCSADLFSSSLTINMDTNTLNMRTETVGMTTENSPLLSASKKQHMTREMFNVPHLTPHKQKLKGNKCRKGDNLIPTCTQVLDFVPPSQSTPIVKAVMTALPVSPYRSSTFGESNSQTDSPDSCALYRNVLKYDGKTPAKAPPLQKHCVTVNQLPQFGRESTKENLVLGTPSNRQRHRLASRRRFWKHKNLLAQQPLTVQRGDQNTQLPGRFNHTSDSSYCDVTVCDNERNEVLFIPPTPATKTPRLSRTDNRSSTLGWTWEEQQGDRGNCITSSQRRLAQTGNCSSETFDNGTLDGSNCDLLDGEKEACDWSRDLFSDSL